MYTYFLKKSDGTEVWYKNGKYHKEDGPAIETPDGYYAWYYNGSKHREDGPAVEYKDGTKFWYYNDLYHRVGGPAVYYGSVWRKYEIHKWYLYGMEMSEEQYNKVMKTCKRAISKFKLRLRRSYVEKLKDINICEDNNLYNIITEYMI